MEKYIECLLNNGVYKTLELYEIDYHQIEEAEVWDKETEDYLSESYFDTKNHGLAKFGYVIQMNELSGGAALISLKNEEDVYLRQFIEHYKKENAIGEYFDIDIIHKINEIAGVDVQDLTFIGSTGVKSKVIEYKDGWIILAAEIVYGKHQYSVSYIRDKDQSDNKWALFDFVEDHNGTRKSRKNRYTRFCNIRKSKKEEGSPKNNVIMNRYLSVLAEGYKIGNFGSFNRFLASDCQKYSQWNYSTEYGYYAVSEYFDKKGRAIKESGAFATECTIVQLKNYSPGKLCLYMEQEIDGQVNGVLVDLELDENNLVSSIGLCIPELFVFEPYNGPEQEHSDDVFSFDSWDVEDLKYAKPFKKQIEKIESELIGKTLEDVFSMGAIFNNYDNEPLDIWEPEYNCIELDEPAVLQFDGANLEVWFYNRSHAKVGINSMTMAEKSYQGYVWRDLTCQLKRIVGKTLKRVFLTTFSKGFYDSIFDGDGDRPDGGDYFESLYLVFENGYALEIYGDEEFMNLAVRRPGTFREFPTDLRLQTTPESYKGMTRSLIPALNEIEISEGTINIAYDDFYYLDAFLLGEGIEVSEYDDYAIPMETWLSALRKWKQACSCSSFDEMIEQATGIDYNDWSVENPRLLNYMARIGTVLWKGKDSSEEMVDELLAWTGMYKEKCNYIMHKGY